MKSNAQFLSAKQVIFPYLLLLYRDNFLKVASLLWKTLSWTIYKIVKNSAQQVSIYYHNVILNSQLSLVLCVAVPCIRVLSSISTGRNLGPWGPATVQAMGYPIHENYFRRLLTRYILHQSIVTEQVLKSRDIISSSVCRLCPLPRIVGAKVRSEMRQSALRPSCVI